MTICDKNEEFVRLFARAEGRLRRYVTAMLPVPSDVDDVMQETAISLMRKFDQYDPDLPFFNWACRFAQFAVKKHRNRMKSNGRQFSCEAIEAIAAEYPHHLQLSVKREKALNDCLNHLGDADRRLVELRYFSEETVDSLSQRTEEPVARLYRSLSRIRRILAHCVRKKLAEEEIT
ncbi:sigma-70 family RNA polymerase sigma factor [Blastopirellula sp. J2-11]|uniref:sigma-70 family RNA polymerase sigma factor n=1 Tax=Blastopirellula sp. J2-11 TaxID=2943192 RepID=UPI0021C85FEF|nr:sigma-70 family RNA polymerase sigma factor [Blastopirellula sp. J2-11]UUO08722.1 sigma-70 family RNA polymerase sigma factor [Blastopirellula sp. J2-11]